MSRKRSVKGIGCLVAVLVGGATRNEAALCAEKNLKSAILQPHTYMPCKGFFSSLHHPTFILRYNVNLSKHFPFFSCPHSSECFCLRESNEQIRKPILLYFIFSIIFFLYKLRGDNVQSFLGFALMKTHKTEARRLKSVRSSFFLWKF